MRKFLMSGHYLWIPLIVEALPSDSKNLFSNLAFFQYLRLLFCLYLTVHHFHPSPFAIFHYHRLIIIPFCCQPMLVRIIKIFTLSLNYTNVSLWSHKYNVYNMTYNQMTMMHIDLLSCFNFILLLYSYVIPVSIFHV